MEVGKDKCIPKKEMIAMYSTREKNLRVFITGDYEFLCRMCGLTGATGTNKIQEKCTSIISMLTRTILLPLVPHQVSGADIGSIYSRLYSPYLAYSSKRSPEVFSCCEEGESIAMSYKTPSLKFLLNRS